ncbi:hypothetical protein [Arthrobacter sp. R-11]|uniref:hypothetical protein n=1 Tax=Arthrobacter sp. R-11 TaxID=3404053 RepID=UPI003CEFE58F
MRRPSARVGRNRRRVCLYTTIGLAGSLMVFAAPNLNGLYLVGALLLLAACGGFVLDSDAHA